MWMSWGQFADCIALPCCFTVVKNFSIRFCCLWLTTKNFLTSVRFASLPFSCYLNNQLTDIDFYLLSSFFTIPVTSRVELFAVVCSTHWDLSLSFFVLCFCLHTFSVLFLSVHLHYLYLFIGTSSQSVSKSMKSRHVSGDKSSKRWDEFTTTEQRTTTTSTDWVVPKTFEIFDALLA